MTDLVVKGVEKWLGGNHILRGASFEANRGTIVALLGASGSGKTTLLRCIAGLEQPERGYINIGGLTALDAEKAIALPPEKRHIGLVFQSYALWPHRNVFDNVAYGLKLRGVTGEPAREKVEAILSKLGLSHLATRFPDQLSGGQQQRVAICRALVYEPRVLLMDEPLSNLDAKLREDARYWIRKLILDLGICAIMVTHDQAEALAMADQVLLLENGVIIQEGTPIDIYTQPASFYAADFLGTNNVLRGRFSGSAAVPTIGGEGWSLAGTILSGAAPDEGAAARAVVRIERIQLVDGPGPNHIRMTLDASLYLGSAWEYRLSHGDLSVKAHGAAKLEPGEVWCHLPADAVWIYPAG
jgi:iron(III) transport system ATP-binding protein